MNQFIASAALEKMASFMALDYLKAEAAKGQRNDFEHYLRSVHYASAAPGDATHTYSLCFQEQLAPVYIAIRADLIKNKHVEAPISAPESASTTQL